MNTKSLLALAFLSTAAAANADTGGSLDGATLSGMLLLAMLAIALVRTGVKEWRRESGKPEPVRLRTRARRYIQP